MLAAIRSLIFMAVFYIGSVPIIIATFLGAFFWPKTIYYMAQYWSRYHYAVSYTHLTLPTTPYV